MRKTNPHYSLLLSSSLCLCLSACGLLGPKEDKIKLDYEYRLRQLSEKVRDQNLIIQKLNDDIKIMSGLDGKGATEATVQYVKEGDISIVDHSQKPAMSREGNDQFYYRKVLEALIDENEKRLVDSKNKLLHFYPESTYADNSLYWVGDFYFKRKNYPKALAQFEDIIQNYPQGNKRVSALLGAARIYRGIGRGSEAMSAYGQVVTHYKGSLEAQEAQREMAKAQKPEISRRRSHKQSHKEPVSSPKKKEETKSRGRRSRSKAN